MGPCIRIIGQKMKQLGIGLIGPGLIGSTLLEQLESQKDILRKDYNIEISILAIANSKKMVLSGRGIEVGVWKDELQQGSQNLDYVALADHLVGSAISRCVIIDCTASDDPPRNYLDWMGKGLSIITPNKRFNSEDINRHKELRKLLASSSLDVHYYFEGTVGAGLPVLITLQQLKATGDKILRVEGVFSGTLSYIFNTFGTDSKSFSEVVIAAKNAGYTEPDPRDDLAGMDVARKVTILARECGIDLELENVPVHSLVPEPLRSCETSEEFLEKLPDFDKDMENLLQDAAQAGECLRFVGVVDPLQKIGTVELRRYPKDHPFAQLSGSDNIISFTTERYSQQPLIIRGPGAGAEVTAGGVFSDILRLLSF